MIQYNKKFVPDNFSKMQLLGINVALTAVLEDMSELINSTSADIARKYINDVMREIKIALLKRVK